MTREDRIAREVLERGLQRVSEAEHRAALEAEGWVWVRRADVPEGVATLLAEGAPEACEPVLLGESPDFLSEDLQASDTTYGIRRWHVSWFGRARSVFRRHDDDPWTLTIAHLPSRYLEEFYAIARRREP